MSPSLPQVGSRQAGPLQSPFHSPPPPAAPLFTRDRYGSADSTATADSVDKEMQEIRDENPWTDGTSIQTIGESDPDKSPQPISSDVNLPPVDTGVKAWSILAGAFLFEALIWGFPLSYGVFQSHYFTSSSSPFKDNTSTSYVGTISTGIFFFGAPLMTYVVEKFPQHRRAMICSGWPLCIAALLGGSFATTIPALIATQGILYAVGELILYLPLMSIINEYFVERRGLAFGIVTCSTGVTGIVLPFVTEQLLTKLGYVSTLRIWALTLAILTGPLLILLKPRIIIAQGPDNISISFLRQPVFWLYTLSNTAHSTALFLPTIFLPQFAAALNLSPTIGALLLALLSTGQVAGQISFGFLSDRSAASPSASSSSTSSSPKKLHLPLNILILLTSLISALSAFFLWGIATNLNLLIPFALIFGFFANGYTVLWPRMGMRLALANPPVATTHSSDSPSPHTESEKHNTLASSTTPDPNPTTILTSFALFSFQKGIGALIAAPVATRLLDLKVTAGMQYGAQGRFAGIILFTGSMMMVSSVVVGGWYCVPRRWRG